MKLQVALDFCKNYQNAKNIIDDIEEYVDIIELGTPLLMECGLDIITKIKSDYPEKIILSDIKIMDAGRYETEEALKAGADIVTIMAVTEKRTIEEGIKVAKEYGRIIMTDLLSVQNIGERIEELDKMGVDYICLHTSKDLQKDGMNMAASFGKYRRCVKNSGIALAGGICSDNVKSYVELNPDIIIVGEGIVAHKDRREKAKLIKEIMAER